MAELDPTTFRPETRALHSGQKPDPATNARAVPIYATTSYVFDDAAHAARLFGLQEFGNIYTRIMNPTTDVFEQRVAALEGGVAALGVASGQAAETLTILNLARAATTSCRPRRSTAGPTTCSRTPCPRSASRRRYVDGSDPSAFGRAINEQTKAVFLELIGNPRLDIHDLASIADVAHARGVPVIVDNTFAPLLAQPIKHGADIVIHSATNGSAGTARPSAASSSTAGRSTGRRRERFKADFVDPDPATTASATRPPSGTSRSSSSCASRVSATSVRRSARSTPSCSSRVSRPCRCGSPATARTPWRSPAGWRPDPRSPGSATRASSRTRRTSLPSAT